MLQDDLHTGRDPEVCYLNHSQTYTPTARTYRDGAEQEVHCLRPLLLPTLHQETFHTLYNVLKRTINFDNWLI